MIKYTPAGRTFETENLQEILFVTELQDEQRSRTFVFVILHKEVIQDMSSAKVNEFLFFFFLYCPEINLYCWNMGGRRTG